MNLGLAELFVQQAKTGWSDMLAHSEFETILDAIDAGLETVRQNDIIFPNSAEIFNSFSFCEPNEVRVVIIGQDPYHGIGQANGLAFSVQNGQKLPPSLRNIYKEVSDDMRCSFFQIGDLSGWARQGVFLLNTILTVSMSKPGSHQKLGWQRFTDLVIKKLSSEYPNIVFILWGNYAKAKKESITDNNHLVLESAHPSPLSAHQGFFGCGHFSKANEFMRSVGHDPIDWCA